MNRKIIKIIYMNLWHEIDPGTKEKMNVVVEINKGSKNKKGVYCWMENYHG